MSSSTAAELKPQSVGIAPISRVIPGALSHSDSVPHKKAQSVGIDGHIREHTAAAQFQAQPARDVLHHFLDAALPSPTVRGRGLRVAAGISADVAVLLGNAVFARGLCRLVQHTASDPVPGVGFAPLHAVLTTLLAYSEGGYEAEVTPDARQETVVLLKALFCATLLVATNMAMAGVGADSTFTLLAALPLNVVTLLGWRAWGRHIVAQKVAEGRTGRNVLIVGGGRIGRTVAAWLGENPAAGRVVRGFIVESGPVGGEILGTVANLAQIARKKFVDEIILTGTENRPLAQMVIREARRHRLDVRIVPDLFGFPAQCHSLELVGDVPTISIHHEALPALALVAKRVLDVAAASAALILVAPLLAITAVAVKLDSPGPVFYRSSRVGKKGRMFICWKFRTMVADAEQRKDQLRARNQRQGPFFKIFDDPRITRLGRILRRYSLDELPQLWNVLMGDMSLVGPRPHPVDDFRQYELSHLRRLDMIPGLTGLWQVAARGDASFDRGMALDLEYIEHWNLWLDLKILWKTMFVVLNGTGA